MTYEAVYDDTLIVADKNWNSVAAKAKTMGYREGIIDGKESVYQEDFDKGYHVGYKYGYSLSVYKAVIEAKKRFCDLNDSEKKILENLEKNEEIAEDLKKPEHGLCQICKTDSLLSKSVNELITQQSEYCKEKQLKLEKNW